MLALKKKREAEAKAKAEAEAAGAAAPPAAQSSSNPTSEPAASSKTKTSLFGIAGKKKSSNKSAEGGGGKKKTPGEIRIQKDIAELENETGTETEFPNPNDLTNFNVYITPQEGYWEGARYEFSFQIPEHYPHSPPKIHCKTQIYHPNIDLEGKVCLNILREKWTPVLDLSQVIFGLVHLFVEPNPKDPLNHEAAELLRRDPNHFERLVSRTLRGGRLDNVQFPKLL